jgi:hypothetical protein
MKSPSAKSPAECALLLSQASGCALGEARGLTCLEPRDQAQLAAVLREARHKNTPVLPIGSGSQLAWCRPDVFETPSFTPIPISLIHLSGIIEQIPGEGTITAQAGTPWSDLISAVAPSGERLPADLPAAESSTLGGVLGSGRSGPDRMKYGPLRHHVLGMLVMLSDGTLAKSGGRQVKNVTGFDLHRLYTGSRGTLAITLEASLRLVPEPQQEWGFSLPVADYAEGFVKAMGVKQAMPRLTWLVLTRVESRVLLKGGLAGCASQVRVDQEQVLAALGDSPESFDLDATRQRRGATEAGSENLFAWDIQSSLRQCSTLLGELEAQLPASTNLWVDCSAGRVLVGLDGNDPARVRPSWAESIAERATLIRPLCVRADLHADLSPTDPSTWTTRLTQGLDPAGILGAAAFSPGRQP